MLWFKKKEEKTPELKEEDSEEESDDKSAVSGNVEVELTKIKSQLEALNEVRKANAEQFTRISEQIGELRGVLMDSNKSISIIEVASTKAIDMVNSVQPDKLMIEVRKTDGKTEALRANIEANESIMKDIMKELKEMRAQMNFYKGADQVVKMNNEIKQEIIDIKKTEGMISKHADKVETIFVEVEKKFYDFEKFNDAVKELDRSFKKISVDFDKLRIGIEEKADKKEFVKLVDKFGDFEKHTTNILKLLDKKSKNTVIELNALFSQLKIQIEKKYSAKIDVKGLTVDETSIDQLAPQGIQKTVVVSSDAIGTAMPDAAFKVISPTTEQSSDKSEKKSDAPEQKDASNTEAKKGMFKFLKKK